MRVYTALLALFMGLSPLMADESFSQFRLDLMLAKRGDAGAQFYVAIGYEEGRGVQKDMAKAVEWYKKAASNNHNGAQYRLGQLYEKGIGVGKNMAMAKKWYRLAADNGSRLAKKRLRQMSSVSTAAHKASLQKQQEQAARAHAEEQARKQQQLKQQQRKQALAKKEREEKARADKARAAKARQAAASKPKAAAKAVYIPGLINIVMKNSWKLNNRPAGLLPSSVNSCLKAGEEIVCFSKEQHRVVAGKQLTFTSKTRIGNFNRKGFTVRYLYNVQDMTGASSRGLSRDPFGLRPQQGWQEPEQSMQCQALSRSKLRCQRNGTSFIYSR